MATDALLDFQKQHSAGQDRYTYFLLAAAGAAIGFAVQKTEGLKLSWWLLPVALASVCWAVSFFFGCKAVTSIQGVLATNYALLQLQAGVHPQQPAEPQVVPIALAGTNKALQDKISSAKFYGEWQFRLLIVGAVLFIAWRVAEMIRITYAP